MAWTLDLSPTWKWTLSQPGYANEILSVVKTYRDLKIAIRDRALV